MDILQTIILGAVEGITEFLPVSSTGHLAIVAEWLGINGGTFLPSFNIAIQLGAILAAIVLYAEKLFTDSALWGRIAVAFLPTAIVGVTLYKFIRPILDNAWVAATALFIGGVVMIVVEKILARQKNIEPLEEDTMPTMRQSFYIGLYQVLSFIPGVSRSAATIIGAMVHNVSRKTAVEFSFLLAIPTMIAATGYDLLRNGAAFSTNDWHILMIGGLVAFITAMFAITWLLAYVKKYTFIPFGVYRIALTVIFVIVLLF
jgi:undecaprenyl-diphosphatase